MSDKIKLNVDHPLYKWACDHIYDQFKLDSFDEFLALTAICKDCGIVLDWTIERYFKYNEYEKEIKKNLLFKFSTDSTKISKIDSGLGINKGYSYPDNYINNIELTLCEPLTNLPRQFLGKSEEESNSIILEDYKKSLLED